MPKEHSAVSLALHLPFRPRGKVLEELALLLQPLVHQWHQLCRDVRLDRQTRSERLLDLERRMRRAGLPRFHQLLREACRAYCASRIVRGTGSSFEVEVFAEGVLVLVHEKLPQFDPRLAGFSTWLARHVYLKVYRDLQRSFNPTWAQVQPTTATGKQQHRQALALARAQSLDEPAWANADQDSSFTLQEILSSVDDTAEKALLEEHCRERFLQAVLALSEADQLLLERVYLRGEAKQDVARSLGRTPGRISQKLAEIFRRLSGELGSHFLDECDDTRFCASLQERTTGGEAGGACVGCEARLAVLSAAVPALLIASHWSGAAEGGPVELDPVEEQSWADLMAQPCSLSVPTMWGLGGGALIAAALALVVLNPQAAMPPSELAFQSPESDTTSSGAGGNTPVEPAEAVVAPGGSADRPTPPRPAKVTQRPTKKTGSEQPRVLRAPTLRIVPVPVPAPMLLASSEPAGGDEFTAGQTPPEPSRGNHGGMAVATTYGPELCRALKADGQWPDSTAETAVLEIVLASGREGVQLAGPPRSVVSGGPALDGALLKAVAALEDVGWPAWQGWPDRSMRVFLIYDNGIRQLSCHAEVVP